MGCWEARADYSYLRATYDANGTLFTGARTVTVAAAPRSRACRAIP
jgi:hypothetical protein